MSDCEHNWRRYEEMSIRCTICDEILDHPEELATELMELFEDLGTMHGLKEQMRQRAEQAEAERDELKAENKRLKARMACLQSREEWVADLERSLTERHT